MSRKVKLAGQGLAVACVAALFGLLLWKLAKDEASDLPAQIAAGEEPAAPAFTLPRVQGAGSVSLASLRGKAVVLNFFASWCEPCEREAPLLAAAAERYDGDVAFVGIDVNDLRPDGRDFARRTGMDYTTLFDRSARTYSAYGLTGLPETFYVDRDGRAVAHSLGEIDTARELEARIEEALAPS